MTPSATTPAGKATTKKRPAEAGHRRTVAPPGRQPRRVSGPTAGAAAARTGAPARAPRPQPPRPAFTTTPKRKPSTRRTPRRVSGPAAQRAPLSARVLAALQSLPDHRLVDRLVRGRAWIPVLGLMLAGIVAMQVEVLKLGANMGRYIERGTYLQGRNESLRASVAALADDQRIERLAAQRGMVMPAPSDIGFLSQGAGAAVGQALANIHAPSPISFLTTVSANGAVVNGDGQSMTGDTAGSVTTSGAGTSSGTSAAAATGSSQSSLSGITSGTSAAVGMASATGTSATSGTTTSPSTASSGSTAADTGASTPSATGGATTAGSAATAGTTGAAGTGVSSTR